MVLFHTINWVNAVHMILLDHGTNPHITWKSAIILMLPCSESCQLLATFQTSSCISVEQGPTSFIYVSRSILSWQQLLIALQFHCRFVHIHSLILYNEVTPCTLKIRVERKLSLVVIAVMSLDTEADQGCVLNSLQLYNHTVGNLWIRILDLFKL